MIRRTSTPTTHRYQIGVPLNCLRGRHRVLRRVFSLTLGVVLIWAVFGSAVNAQTTTSSSGWFYSCNYRVESGTSSYAWARTSDLNNNCMTLNARVKFSKNINLTSPYFYSSWTVTSGPVAYSQATSAGYAYQGHHYISTISNGYTRGSSR